MRGIALSRPRPLGPWKMQGEAAALARAALHRDPSPVSVHDVLHQRQAHPAPAPALGLTPPDAVELLEDSLPLRQGDAAPLVGNLDRPPGPLPAGLVPDLPPIPRVLQGVVEEVGQR